MHGLFHGQLRSFVEAQAGPPAWAAVLDAAGLSGRAYALDGTYPDSELLALIDAAGARLGRSRGAVLEGLGAHMAPFLLGAHRLPEGWGTLDVVEHSEHAMDATARRQDPAARPPRIRAVRRSPNEVALVYASRRRLCDLARGIVRGVAEQLGDEVELSDARCMSRGDATCELRVRLAAAS